MLVSVQFNTEDESELSLLRLVLNPEAEEDAPAPTKAKAAPAKKAAAAKKPKFTLEDVVAAAHAKVSDGKKHKIPEALAAVEGSRVSKLEPSQFEKFMEVLEAEDEDDGI